ncbi:uncharacterized protein PHACADRAFT_153969 [Phanerochaete carnosa HHB-10118-sp]|uniref:F-box domain-containing protein n=1 Tax=Phanerochaete carnosa (strain HHB-10118-sp) TaxID=650164 RepID=K5WH47_PHACS|nr:uncharacterized protein PHACADRAFT_153969 [Phanerochaete carnosa HHB-10118-sp]EKM49542.1 hypothetical protein PHACADRAFT_153969 [Phanerochaete carnosa HHB-10118-sp]
MDRCPVELWMKIITLACIDGGYTGSSLSFVSRTMRDVVEPLRFQSVSLISEEQQLAFSNLLRARGPSPPVIRHLLVFVKMHRGDEAEPDDAAKTVGLQQTLRDILSVAAPNLETLVVHDTRFDLASSGLVFPALCNLSVDGLGCSSETVSRFPSLRRLHITSEYESSAGFWSGLAHSAPSLTHLRLSCLYLLDLFTPSFLCAFLDSPVVVEADEDTPSSEEGAAIARKLPTLKHIIVQPYQPSIFDGWCGNIAERHFTMQSELCKIAHACAQRQGIGKLYVLPSSYAYDVDEAQRDWLDTIEGGDGAWSANTEEHTSYL